MAITEALFGSKQAAETERRRKEASRDLGDMVDRMVDARRTEPDVELALAICASVNQRGAASSAIWDVTGRVAQVMRNGPPASCLLALFLADVLAIHCGFPAHLAVTRRDFLNALVYRFPSSGNDTDPVQAAVLRLLSKWRATLCANDSPHAGDFALVREACTLLTSRGFIVPAPDTDDVAAMRASGLIPPRLRTKEEILRDDGIVQEAKLQLLLRRGRPEDLRTANRLMRMLAAQGASTDAAAVTKADRTIETDLQAVDSVRMRLCELISTQDSPCAEQESLLEELRASLPRLHRLAASSDLHPTTLEHTIVLYGSVRDTLAAVGESWDALVSEAMPSECVKIAPPHCHPSSVADAFALIQLDDCPTDGLGKSEGIIACATGGEVSRESLLDGPSESLSVPDPFDKLVNSMISGAQRDEGVKAAWAGSGVLVQVVTDGKATWTLVANMSSPVEVHAGGVAVSSGSCVMISGSLFAADEASISVSIGPDGQTVSLSRL